MTKTPIKDNIDNTSIDNADNPSADEHPSLYNISVYGSKIYQHSEIPDEVAHTHEHEHAPKPSKLLTHVAVAIIFLLIGYGILFCLGIPQDLTKATNTPPGHVYCYETHEYVKHGKDHLYEPVEGYPPLFMIIPFVGLLLCIAILPLFNATAHWWESNTNRFLVAAGFGLLTLAYYAFMCQVPVEGHWPNHYVVYPSVGGKYDPAEVGEYAVVSNFAIAGAIFKNAIMNEYIPFIVLLFSLFVITGGIRISGNFRATPLVNTSILGIGAFFASFIGTTGAAMLLIRFLLETNKRRKHKVHTVVFFIFTVCNAGGCLTPLGDPPLFLGYLRGISFFWTMEALWLPWLFLNILLLAVYFLWDTWYCKHESGKHKETDGTHGTGFLITGWAVQVPLLLGVIASVALLAPNKPFLGWEGYYPPYYLREAVQLALAALSILLGSYVIRKRNAFNFLAIGEVAALFFGIFICMQAPLQMINVHGNNMVARAEATTGLHKETIFFWSTASLSMFLDNAPTYVVFFETARTLSPGLTEEEAKESWKRIWEESGKEREFRELRPVPVGKQGFIDHHLLVAIALGTIFIGGMTYIANGPNFMVKAIAEHAGVKMPSFFGFMGYSFLILLPLIFITSLIFI